MVTYLKIECAQSTTSISTDYEFHFTPNIKEKQNRMLSLGKYIAQKIHLMECTRAMHLLVGRALLEHRHNHVACAYHTYYSPSKIYVS